MNIGQLIDIVKVNIFRKYFALFEGLGSRSKCFLNCQPTTNNKEPITMSLRFLSLLKDCTEEMNNMKHHLMKSHYIAISSKS